MPIDEQEWEAGDSQMSNHDRIIDFLQDEYPKAYSPQEISEEMATQRPSASQEDLTREQESFRAIEERIMEIAYSVILNNLEHEGVLESRKIEEEGWKRTYVRYNN